MYVQVAVPSVGQRWVVGGGGGIGGGGKKATLLKMCFTYPTMIKLGRYTLPKEDLKNILLESH